MKKKKFKKIPDFKTEEEEVEFWETHDTTEYLDWSKAIRNPSFPNLKMTKDLHKKSSNYKTA